MSGDDPFSYQFSSLEGVTFFESVTVVVERKKLWIINIHVTICASFKAELSDFERCFKTLEMWLREGKEKFPSHFFLLLRRLFCSEMF